jgi:hypothetical protein
MAKVSDIKLGLEIAIQKFGPDYQFGGAQHDVVYLFPPDVELSEAEKSLLEGADWILSEQEGWMHFV